MKIATYNINGIHGRLDVLLRWLKKAQPDIVCLQELKSEYNKFPEKAVNDAGYQAIWLGQKSWNGVAILSKTDIKELRDDLPGADEEFTHSRYIEGFTGDIVVGCIYLPNGNPWPGPKFDYKLRWFNRLADHAKDLVDRDLPVLLIGDYNVMPTELDTYKPEKYRDNALFRPESRKAFKDLLDQGWTDAIRTLYPDEPIYTFWDYLRDAYGRNAGVRLDHFLLNKQIAGRLIAGNVDKEVRGWKGASDHAPVWIELTDENEAPKQGKIKKTKVKAAGPEKEEISTEPKGLAELLNELPKVPVLAAIKPMKATLVDEPFDQPGWIYEIKWDGYRALATLNEGQATLTSRNNLVFGQFQPINDLLESWDMNVVLDGEIVALNEQGTADFGALQNWRNKKNALLAFYVFDILWYNGRDLTGLPLRSRREILDAVLPKNSELIRPSQVFEVGGIEFFEAAKKMGLEGIIAKRADSLYTSDARSREWLKVKAKRRQEVIIAGFTKNEGTGKYFSALAIGVHDQRGVLRYIGKVGTGFNDGRQKEMIKLFEPLITKESPFDIEPDVDEPSQFRPRRLGAKATWLKPLLVCEVEFAEITSDGKVRQASFKGMRTDKDPKDVVMEIETDTQEIIGDINSPDDPLPIVPTQKAARKSRKGSVLQSSKKPAERLITSTKETEEVKVDGHLLKLTHLNKLYWPEDKVTKRDMFNYYHQVAPFMVPYLKDRPMSLNRFPGGIHGESFYQKNVRDKAPEWAETMPHTNGEGVDKDYLLGNNEATLLWMASLGCIEINPWFSRITSPDNPDYCIIDLDPDKQHFDQVVQAAQEVKKVLDAIDVPSYPKTSGSTGMHIYIPLGAQYTYDQSQLFANIIVKLVEKQIPDFTTLERMISNRKGKMYLDFLQNRPGATIAGVYSLRPKPGATVSMPVTWEEVKPGLTMRDFTIHNAIDRIRETGDLFTGVLGEGIDLAKTLKKAQSIFN
ncbi:DNA ligase D [Mucilaginibacter terrenus]|uniref:DNA ligase (ATP) n=1 Tax=Mucilaginibacter terrenus TaxID=2482727 RepID=A0A3E2NW35_9SPHI|nr:DNA ligase D [Mucilaginibacter terrenus]RFZ85179.1 DNA ligase D [Mucilaginibacter terrenus]